MTPKKLTSKIYNTSHIQKTSQTLKRILPSFNINSNTAKEDTYSSKYKINRPVKKRKILTFGLLERIFRNQKDLICNKLTKINKSLFEACCVKDFFLLNTEEQKQNFALIEHFKYQEKKQDLKIGEKIYYLDTKQDSYKFIDKEKKYILTNWYPKTYNKYQWKVTFYKNDSKKELKFKDKDSKVVLYKDKSQNFDYKNKSYLITPSGAKTLCSKYHDKYNNKDIGIVLDYCNNSTNPYSYLYVEHKDNMMKGVLFNEKLNGDNHTGMIAFPPKSF